MTSLSQSVNELDTLISQTKEEIASLESGRKASASRARSHLMKVKTLCHTLRKDIQSHKTSLPTKTRAEKPPPEPEKPEPEEPVKKIVKKPRAKKPSKE